jgi:hypothetical protein
VKKQTVQEKESCQLPVVKVKGNRSVKVQVCKAELIIAQLKSEGWKEQMSGTNYINGTLGTNLLKDGEVVTIQQEFCPDDDFIEQEWPEKQK